MPPVISFIGWHNSGKTTLASQVVAHLKDRGYLVAVIKSTKEKGIETDQPRTDTAVYRGVGADSVALVAPDQLILRAKAPQSDLLTLAHRYCSEMDIVIAEGFKHAVNVPKIEVRRDHEAPLLRDQVTGVIAVATDLPLAGDIVFHLDQSKAIADFIETRFLKTQQTPAAQAQVELIIDNSTLPLPESICDQLSAAVFTLLDPLHPSLHKATMELRIRCNRSSQESH
jgi:molybdopterin-guanine dinucleotide biosynthesis protein B